MKSKLRHVRTYQATDPNRPGSRVTIRVLQEFLLVETLGGSSEEPGLEQHRLENGDPINVLDDGNLEDVRTGRKLRRV